MWFRHPCWTQFQTIVSPPVGDRFFYCLMYWHSHIIFKCIYIRVGKYLILLIWEMGRTTEQKKRSSFLVTRGDDRFFCGKIVFTSWVWRFENDRGVPWLQWAIVFHSRFRWVRWPHQPLPPERSAPWAIVIHKAIGLHTQSVHVDFPHLASPHLTKAIVIHKAIGLHTMSGVTVYTLWGLHHKAIGGSTPRAFRVMPGWSFIVRIQSIKRYFPEVALRCPVAQARTSARIFENCFAFLEKTVSGLIKWKKI